MTPEIKQGDIVFVDGEGIKICVNPSEDMIRHKDRLKMVLRRRKQVDAWVWEYYEIIYERK